MQKIRKGDRVVVLSGRDKGKKGEVFKVMSKEGRALVRGVNTVRKHQRQTVKEEGGIVTKELPVHVSNVMFLEDGQPVRVGYKIGEDGRKVRISRKTGKEIG